MYSEVSTLALHSVSMCQCVNVSACQYGLKLKICQPSGQKIIVVYRNQLIVHVYLVG